MGPLGLNGMKILPYQINIGLFHSNIILFGRLYYIQSLQAKKNKILDEKIKKYMILTSRNLQF